MVEGARLEIVCALIAHLGFKSLTLRQREILPIYVRQDFYFVFLASLKNSSQSAWISWSFLGLSNSVRYHIGIVVTVLIITVRNFVVPSEQSLQVRRRDAGVIPFAVGFTQHQQLDLALSGA